MRMIMLKVVGSTDWKKKTPKGISVEKAWRGVVQKS
jgi:hypothetical protein